MAQIKITRKVAAKVLATVDAGLAHGLGKAEPGFMCVEAAVCYALGLPHGDNPACVSPAIRSLKITLNDRNWSSNAARAKGMRRLALAQLGSAGAVDDREFAKRVAEMAIRKMVPIALRAAASIQKDAKHRDALLSAANKCEVEGTRASALEARAAAYAAAYDANAAAYAAAYDANAAAYAAAYDANAAAAADADAAYDAAYAAADAATNAANAAYAAAADAAAYAAADAADAAAYATNAATNAAADDAAAKRDAILSEFAEAAVQILIDMKAPGCEWLDLAQAA